MSRTTILGAAALTIAALVASTSPAATAAAGPAPTQECVDIARLVRTMAGVNVREGAGTAHEVIGTVAADHFVWMTDHSDSNDAWYQVHWYGGQTGWIARTDPRTGDALSEAPWLGKKPCNGSRPVVEPIPAELLAKIEKLDLDGRKRS